MYNKTEETEMLTNIFERAFQIRRNCLVLVAGTLYLFIHEVNFVSWFKLKGGKVTSSDALLFSTLRYSFQPKTAVDSHRALRNITRGCTPNAFTFELHSEIR